MFNHTRGLWGYSGAHQGDGEPLTIQSTGLGGPSAAIVLEELGALGLRRAIRVGAAGALEAAAALGELLVVERALCADGTSAALGALGEVDPDPALLETLRARGGERAVSGAVVSADLFHESGAERLAGWRERGARALDLSSAALFALGARRGIEVAAIVVISRRVGGTQALAAGAMLAASLAAGHLAADALGVEA